MWTIWVSFRCIGITGSPSPDPEEDVFRKLTAAELAEEQTIQEAQGFEMKME